MTWPKCVVVSEKAHVVLCNGAFNLWKLLCHADTLVVAMALFAGRWWQFVEEIFSKNPFNWKFELNCSIHGDQLADQNVDPKLYL